MSNQMLAIPKDVYDYIRRLSLREPDILARLRMETERLGNVSAMQICPEQGQFMALLVELLNAKTLLEVGTFTGYSTLVCALALPPEGRVITCDVSKEWTAIARRYWEEAGVSPKIDLRLAPAAETLQGLIRNGQENTVDMMFIDADKTGYDTYYELGLKLVRPGGLILFDNVLWGGSVAKMTCQDEDTNAIRALNAKLHGDKRVSISMLPLGDGLTLARKRN